MDLEKLFFYSLPALTGLLVLGAVLHFTDKLIISISLMIGGIYFLGFSTPDIIEEWTGSGYSVLVPVLFSVLIVLGAFLTIGPNAAGIIFSSWCSKPPCVPLIYFALSFVMGNLANWAGHILNNDEIEILSW